MKIVAFGHRRRVGKDTAGKFLLSYIRTERKSITVERCSPGDKIKETAYHMFKWAGLNQGVYYENNPDLKETVLPTLGKSPRDIWIDVGNFGRAIDIRIWMETAIASANSDLVILTDLRTQTEVEYVRKFGGICIRVDRAIPKASDNLDCALEDFQGWDYVIENNGTLKEFRSKVISVFEEALDVGKV